MDLSMSMGTMWFPQFMPTWHLDPALQPHEPNQQFGLILINLIGVHFNVKQMININIWSLLLSGNTELSRD